MATFTLASRLREHPDHVGRRDGDVRARRGRTRKRRLAVQRPSVEENLLGGRSIRGDDDIREHEAAPLDGGGDEFASLNAQEQGAYKIQPAAGPTGEIAAVDRKQDEGGADDPDE